MRILLTLCVLAVLSGCATTQNGHSTSGASTALPNTHETRAALYDQHAQWQGTPYLLGGLSQNGIDCSGFVLTTFRQQFGIDLPRTTQVQASLGKPVRQNDLQAGDLVFFRTGKRTQHVGIYVENRTFLHASTSQGVTLSQLDNPYWQSSFWRARRID
ncbi:NlpC/P60 family protein [Alkalilimnicola ehrlichii]|uniref:Peptidase P60 n=1 Tax=Alkalilimnicola ehrlichii TaxID=351052 RepID=A0A3E0WQ99_9GAMM|nr:NlpC/P60 family protein [Alkalilimnicola ehrlichii]RFA34373.1 peptidase P60 [Alkalilimnicola ehrlichii]